MFNSWYNILELTKFFNQCLVGFSFHTPFTYQKNELYLPIINHPEYSSIHFSIKNPLPFLIPEEHTPKTHKVVKILKGLDGNIIEKVLIHKSDRQILFVFSKNCGYLLFQLFGSNGNALFLDPDFQIFDCYKKNKKLDIPIFNDFIESSYYELNFNKKICFETYHDKNIFQFLKLLPMKLYSKQLREEICYRSGIDGKELVVNLTNYQKDNIIGVINDILTELNSSNFYIYNSIPPMVSLISYQSVNFDKTIYTNYIDFLKGFIGQFYKGFYFSQKKKQLEQQFIKFIYILGKRIFAQKQNLINLPELDDYREYGDTILANIYRISTNQDEITLPRLTNPDLKLTISLDKRLSPAQNAEKYYRKSKNLSKSKHDLLSSISINVLLQKKMEKILAEIKNSIDIKELKKFEKNLPAEMIKQNEKEDSRTRIPYKKYYYKNWEILIGKSAKDNDVLTFKVGKPNDFWLHAHKITGSHVIVRNPEKKESIPKDILERAAGFAAFFSKAKHSSVVSVIYTRRKYVWKKKAMSPGQVNLKYEKSTIVEPYDPGN